MNIDKEIQDELGELKKNIEMNQNKILMYENYLNLSLSKNKIKDFFRCFLYNCGLLILLCLLFLFLSVLGYLAKDFILMVFPLLIALFTINPMVSKMTRSSIQFQIMQVKMKITSDSNKIKTIEDNTQ